MLEIISSGGWLMLPILASSVLALAICIERSIALQIRKIIPEHLLLKLNQLGTGEINTKKLAESTPGSLLGEVLEVGLNNSQHDLEITKQAVEEAGSVAVRKMERYLTTLGSIAAIAPLLGLLGTVLGMIKVFSSVKLAGRLDSQLFAGGISEALATTAVALIVAIPALACYRYFVRKVDELTLTIETAAGRLLIFLQKDAH